MELIKGVVNYNSTLFLKKSRTLIISDLHIGAEEELINKGILIPKTQIRNTLLLIKKAIKKFAPEKIILNGDVKHEFGTINKQEWDETIKIIDYLRKKAELIIIKGNHDVIIEPILKKRGLKTKSYELIDNYYITHGHKLPETKEEKGAFKKADTIIIGHEHPTITLDNGVRKEKYKSFIIGDYITGSSAKDSNSKKIIIMPSTYPLIEGSNILRSTISPFSNKIMNAEAILIEGNKEYYFGRIKDLLKNNLITEE